jgi:hypothetical protein
MPFTTGLYVRAKLLQLSPISEWRHAIIEAGADELGRGVL